MTQRQLTRQERIATMRAVIEDAQRQLPSLAYFSVERIQFKFLNHTLVGDGHWNITYEGFLDGKRIVGPYNFFLPRPYRR